ncbi:MAG: VWA domain-containing protein [Acidobacteria bacterium]|nr:VWA domain-containing protein [Acidobacteriota bacterium]
MSARSGKIYRSGRAAIACSTLLAVLLLSFLVLAQSGRNPVSGRRSSVINIIGRRSEDPNRPKRLLSPAEEEQAAQERIIPREVVSLFDAGVPQRIESFSPDPTPARYVVLMDNSSTLQADVRKLATVPAAFAPEIYEGDKVMVIGYDQKPEIITDFTDEPDKLQGTLELLRKSDTPRLYDALNVVLEDVLRPEVGFSKRIILIVGDGLDRGSVIRFEEILAKLQNENITIYAVQVRDRTRGALRKDQPKPVEVLRQLTGGTGGRIYPIDGDTKAAIKEVCDEIRNDRYLLSYYPEGVNPINKRLILLSSTDPTVTFHYKGWHPPAKF